jgi:protease-4
MSRLMLCGLFVALLLLVRGGFADDTNKPAAPEAKTEQVGSDEKQQDRKKTVKEETKEVKKESKEEEEQSEAAANEESSGEKTVAETEQSKPKEKPSKLKDHKKGKEKSKSEKKSPKKSAPSQALHFGISFGSGGVKVGISAGSPTEKDGSPKTNVVRFTLKGEYPEGANAPGLFGELKPSLASLVERFDAVAKDKDVAAVWLKIEDLSLGRGKIYELRQAIQRIRRAKKPVYAELTSADTGEYLVAAACDEIWMPECGMLMIPGVRMEVTFFKRLLDKIGVEFDVLKMGKYKGAAEPLTRNTMSRALRKSYEAVADDVYADLVETLVADRKLKDYKVKTLIDEGFFHAQAARDAGLIDRVFYADEFEATLKKNLKTEKINVITNYLRKKRELDFSGLSGFVKFMQLMMGQEPGPAATAKQKIAVVYAVGPILEGKSRSDLFGENTLGSTTMVAALEKADQDPKVLAIVMRIDSPGGSAVASDLIWRETTRLKKPLIVSMSDVAGSGGYYIAIGAKKIYATPSTITGSIGVLGGKLVAKGLFEKLGLHQEVISRGANSGSMSLTEPFSPEQRKVWTALLQEVYRQFVSKAARGRKMPYEKLEQLAQGRIYTGRTAKQLGLIDELGSLHDAVAAAKEAAGLKPDAEVEILTLPQPRSIFEQLFGDPAADSNFDSLLPEAARLLRHSQLLQKMFSEPAVLWMPYQVEIR